MTLFTKQEQQFDLANLGKTFKNSDKVMLFRHSDLDGVGTEIVARLFFDDVYSKQCEYSNVNDIILAFIEGGEYIHYDQIIVADISFNEEIAELIYNNENLCNKFMLVDHHKTAEWLNKYPFSIVEVERNGVKASGTSSLFEILRNFDVPFVNKNTNIDSVQIFVEKVRRYDTWEWSNVYSDNDANMLNELFFKTGATNFIENSLTKLNKPIQRFMEGNWVDLFSDKEDYLLSILEDDKSSYINGKIKKAQYGKFGEMVYAYVIAENHISQLGNQMCERLDIEFAIILDLSRSKVSLRSKSADICDVSVIAKSLNGGGHACASGFELELNWDSFVETIINGEHKLRKVSLKQKFRNLLDKFIK